MAAGAGHACSNDLNAVVILRSFLGDHIGGMSRPSATFDVEMKVHRSPC
jgi:hypothetical protein